MGYVDVKWGRMYELKNRGIKYANSRETLYRISDIAL